jgi:Ni,Fe-hydrogenase III small subunit/formate hydrogenlyase subunit 6/NADH:ubiquinone oxidoreductase subunit I
MGEVATMFDVWRTRLAQGMQTSPYPEGEVVFPERFRGRPVMDCSACQTTRCPDCAGDIPTAVLRPGEDGRATLDLGACLFSPEEACGTPECGVRFTHDHRMSTRDRAALLTPNGEVVLANALGASMRRLFGRSLRLRSVVAGSCNGCEGELSALGNVVYDMGRFGIQFVASPRHADGIVVTGAINTNMRDALYRTYEAVPDPRLVIAVGACPASGGPFRGSPEIDGGIPSDIPVDLWIPGCPPHPLTILDGLLRLLGQLA